MVTIRQALEQGATRQEIREQLIAQRRGETFSGRLQEQESSETLQQTEPTERKQLEPEQVSETKYRIGGTIYSRAEVEQAESLIFRGKAFAARGDPRMTRLIQKLRAGGRRSAEEIQQQREQATQVQYVDELGQPISIAPELVDKQSGRVLKIEEVEKRQAKKQLIEDAGFETKPQIEELEPAYKQITPDRFERRELSYPEKIKEARTPLERLDRILEPLEEFTGQAAGKRISGDISKQIRGDRFESEASSEDVFQLLSLPFVGASAGKARKVAKTIPSKTVFVSEISPTTVQGTTRVGVVAKTLAKGKKPSITISEQFIKSADEFDDIILGLERGFTSTRKGKPIFDVARGKRVIKYDVKPFSSIGATETTASARAYEKQIANVVDDLLSSPTTTKALGRGKGVISGSVIDDSTRVKVGGGIKDVTDDVSIFRGGRIKTGEELLKGKSGEKLTEVATGKGEIQKVTDEIFGFVTQRKPSAGGAVSTGTQLKTTDKAIQKSIEKQLGNILKQTTKTIKTVPPRASKRQTISTITRNIEKTISGAVPKTKQRQKQTPIQKEIKKITSIPKQKGAQKERQKQRAVTISELTQKTKQLSNIKQATKLKQAQSEKQLFKQLTGQKQAQRQANRLKSVSELSIKTPRIPRTPTVTETPSPPIIPFDFESERILESSFTRGVRKVRDIPIYTPSFTATALGIRKEFSEKDLRKLTSGFSSGIGIRPIPVRRTKKKGKRRIKRRTNSLSLLN